jgi:hypothetical protein
MSAYMKFLALVGHDQASTDSDPWKTTDSQLIERFSNTPIFTAAVARFVGALANSANVSAPPVPQYGLIGIHETIRDDSLTPVERLVMTNTTIPWSTFICGSQGSGKSHTFSCLLENALVQSDFIGALPHPLTGLVMHYDKYTSHSTTQVCEAAYLCSAGIPVNVLVSPSNIWTMKRLYANLPGLPADAPRPKVLPLYLDEHHLSIGRILKLMAVDTSEKTVPLYMEVITSILREMAMEGTAFTYTEFRKRVDAVDWVRGQEIPLKLRLQLLDSFMAPSEITTSTRPARAQEDIWTFAPGSLTILDLSDPFMSSEDACALFSISLSIFLENRDKCGQVVAMDEAHKVSLCD